MIGCPSSCCGGQGRKEQARWSVDFQCLKVVAGHSSISSGTAHCRGQKFKHYSGGDALKLRENYIRHEQDLLETDIYIHCKKRHRTFLPTVLILNQNELFLSLSVRSAKKMYLC